MARGYHVGTTPFGYQIGYLTAALRPIFIAPEGKSSHTPGGSALCKSAFHAGDHRFESGWGYYSAAAARWIMPAMPARRSQPPAKRVAISLTHSAIAFGTAALLVAVAGMAGWIAALVATGILVIVYLARERL